MSYQIVGYRHREAKQRNTGMFHLRYDRRTGSEAQSEK